MQAAGITIYTRYYNIFVMAVNFQLRSPEPVCRRLSAAPRANRHGRAGNAALAETKPARVDGTPRKMQKKPPLAGRFWVAYNALARLLRLVDVVPGAGIGHTVERARSRALAAEVELEDLRASSRAQRRIRCRCRQNRNPTAVRSKLG